MPGDRDAEVDPRFDPVFQRGYDPKLHGGRRPRGAPRHGAEPVPIDSAREPSAPRQTAARPHAEPGAPPAASEPVARRHEVVASVVTEPVAAHRNPFRLALLVASVVAIAGAALIMWRQINDPYRYGATGTDVGAQFLQQFTDALAVPLLTGGLIGVTLWLAVGALQRRDVIAADRDAGS